MKTTDYQSPPAFSIDAHPWVMRVPVISTGHIHSEDNRRLRDEDIGNGPVMADLQTGYLLLIEDFPSNFEGYSDAFLHLLETFHHLGFHYLRLDCDGELLDDLPQFEW